MARSGQRDTIQGGGGWEARHGTCHLIEEDKGTTEDGYTCGQSKGGSGSGTVSRGALCRLDGTRMLGGAGARGGVVALHAQCTRRDDAMQREHACVGDRGYGHAMPLHPERK